MADINSLLAQAANPQEVALLLSALGQTGPMASPTAVQQDPMNLSSARAAELMLTSMGQTTRGAMPAVAVDPLFRASGEFFQTDIGNAGNSVEAVRALLNGMGQTGSMSEKVPMSPSTSAGIAKNPAGMEGGDYKTPLSAEDRMFIDATFGYNGAPPVESLLATKAGLPDDGMRDIPRTGKADTRGGVNRVNQYTAEHGVTATRDEKTGQVTLTNIGANGKPTPQSQKQVYGFNPMNGTSSAVLDTLYEQIKNASDPDTARGLAATARVALAEESAKMEAESLKFAENKIGLPNLVRRLKESEALDQSAPGYMPGIGDSKNTAALRNEVAQAQAQARQVAGDFKTGNISAARLNAMGLNINAELARIDQIARKNESLDATTRAQKERKDLEKAERDYVRFQAFTPNQRKLLAELNPDLANEKDNMGATVAFYERQVKADPNFEEFFNADPSERLLIAASGNKIARDLIIKQESVNTGRAPEDIDRDLKSMRNLITPASIRQWAVDNSANVVGDKVAARGQRIADYDLLLGSKKPEDQQRLRMIQGEIAVAEFSRQKTAKFAADVTSWIGGNPELQKAAEDAKRVSGKTDIDSVLTAYVGATTGPESLTRYASFKEAIRAAAAKESKSAFGGIDQAAVLSLVDTAAKEKGALAAWYKDRYGWTEDASRAIVTSIANLFGQ